MEITKDLVNFCIELKFNKLPEEVIDKAKYLALDYIGIAARGSLQYSSKVMYRVIKAISSTSEGGVIIGTNMRAPYQYAALANGTSAHALELDDVNNEASLHPGNVTFPAAFAACEMVGADGKRFIEGVAVGYEVTVRLGKALGPSAHYAQGFHPTATCGVFGAAAAVAKILGFNKEQTLNAMGISGSLAAGSLEFLTEGAWTKRMHPGWSTHSGIIAALLGKNGFKGPSKILEGKYGFLHAYSPSSDGSKVLEGIGNSYQILRTSIKPHACCRYKQGPIDGVLKIMKENQLKAEEIESVKLGILKTGFPVVAEPEALKYNPRSVVDSQFSMPFGAAVAMLYGKASLDEYTQENVNSSKVKEVMAKISCVQDPELDKVYPKQWPATVEIKTKKDETFFTRIEYPKGDPENALTWDEIIDKFRGLVSTVYTKDQAEQIIQQIRRIDEEKNLGQCTPMFLSDH